MMCHRVVWTEAEGFVQRKNNKKSKNLEILEQTTEQLHCEDHLCISVLAVMQWVTAGILSEEECLRQT